MTDQPRNPEPDAIDIDPYADDDGRIGATFDDEVGDDIAALLADPTMWEEPTAFLGDDVVRVIGIEAATIGASELQPTTRTGRESKSDSGELTSAMPDPGSEGGAEVIPISRFRQLRPALLGAAAAIFVVIGGIIAFSAASETSDQQEFALELIPTGLVANVGGDISVTSTESGLRVDLEADSLPRRASGRFYQGWLRLDDDNLVPIGSFHEGDGVVLWAGIELERVQSFTITLEAAAPADSADHGSSGQVVLKVDFPTP